MQHLVNYPVTPEDNNEGLIFGVETVCDEDPTNVLDIHWYQTKEEAIASMERKINKFSLNFEWMDGRKESMNESLPEYLRDEIMNYFSELQDLRDRQDRENENDPDEQYSYESDEPVNIDQ